MPYLYAAAVQAHTEGVPMMRAMVLEFPGDPACATLDRQYMLGDSLLVAPVFAEDGSAEFYLPEGRWTHLLTGEVREGGKWHQSQHDFLSLPLYVRSNSVLALGNRDDRPDYAFEQDTTFAIYQLHEGATASARVVKQNGAHAAEIQVKRVGQSVTAVVNGTLSGRWKVQLPGTARVSKVSGGEVTSTPTGVVITATSGSSNVQWDL